MLRESSELRPPRYFFPSAALVAAAGLALGGLILSPQSFRMTINVGVAITTVASGFAMQISTPWSTSQRALLLVAIGGVGVAFGMIGRFLI